MAEAQTKTFNNPIETDAKGDPVPDQGSGDIGGDTALDASFAPDGSDDAGFMAELGGYEKESHRESQGAEGADASEPTGYTPTEGDRVEPNQPKDPTEPKLEVEPAFPGVEDITPETATTSATTSATQTATPSDLDQDFARKFNLGPDASVPDAQAAMGQDFHRILQLQSQPGGIPQRNGLPIAPAGPPQPQQPIPMPSGASAPVLAPAPAVPGSGQTAPAGMTSQQADAMVEQFGDDLKPALDQIQTVTRQLAEQQQVLAMQRQEFHAQTQWIQQQQAAEARSIVERQLKPFESVLKDVYGAAGTRTQANQKAVGDLTEMAGNYQIAKQSQGYPVTDEQAVLAAIYGQHSEALNKNAGREAREALATKVEKRSRAMDVTGGPGAVGRKPAAHGSDQAFMQEISSYINNPTGPGI